MSPRDVATSAIRRAAGVAGVVLGWLLRASPAGRLGVARRIQGISSIAVRVELERCVSDRVLADRPATGFATTRAGASIEVDTTDLIQRSIAVSGVWEPSITGLIDALLGDGDSFVDVGANIGYYTLEAHHVVGPTGRLRAIEASPTLFPTLVGNLARNGIDPDVAQHAALIDGFSTVTVAPVAWANLGSVTTSGVAAGDDATGVVVPGVSLVDVVAGLPTDRPLVVKVDIDGSEFAARQGIESLLTTWSGEIALVIEVTPSTAYGFAVSTHDDADRARHEAMPADLAARGSMALYSIANSVGMTSRYPRRPALPRPVTGFHEGTFDYLLVRGEVLADRLASWMATSAGT
jgi:FkbM family methyltransferase